MSQLFSAETTTELTPPETERKMCSQIYFPKGLEQRPPWFLTSETGWTKIPKPQIVPFDTCPTVFHRPDINKRPSTVTANPNDRSQKSNIPESADAAPTKHIIRTHRFLPIPKMHPLKRSGRKVSPGHPDLKLNYPKSLKPHTRSVYVKKGSNVLGFF